MSYPAVFHPFDSLLLSDFDQNTLVLPPSRNHTLDNILNQTTDRMIDLIPVQKKRQFYGRSNASSAGLVAAVRWSSTISVDEAEATSVDQMKEAAQKAYQSMYQSSSQAMNHHAQQTSNQRNLQSSIATTNSINSQASAPAEQSFNQSSNQSSPCPCSCHHPANPTSPRLDENSNTPNLPSKSPRKHSNNRSGNPSTLASPINSRPGTASRPATMQSGTAIYRGGQSKMTESELMDPPSQLGSGLDHALEELERSVDNLSVDQSVHQSARPSSASNKTKKKKNIQPPSKKPQTDEQKAAALARRAVRQAEVDRKKRDDAVKLAQVKADDKFYHEMMLKQYERRVKMQEFQRRHESQRAERLRQANDANLPSKLLSKSQSSFAPARSFSHRFQPHSSASIVNDKPVFAEFGATNTRTKIKANYMKTHNITPDLPPNRAREAQSYSQARRAAINQLH